jgi:endoglucanase
MFDLVKALCDLPGPSGYEHAVQVAVSDWLRAAGAEVTRTPVGNLLARLGGRGKRLVVAVHADEIGAIVQSITDDGFVLVMAGGGPISSTFPPYHTLPGQHCLVMTSRDPVRGVFGARTGHLRVGSKSPREALEWDEVFVDIGARSRAEAEASGIHPGAGVIWNPPPVSRIGANIVGKAMDDRAAMAIVVETARRLDRNRLGYEVWIASTVQEEIRMVGAASLRDYDLGIAVDVGLVGDVPGVSRLEMPAALGAGPMLVHKDSGVRYDREITLALARVAEEEGIPVQHAAFKSYFSDGSSMIQNGIPTALVCFPARYTHSPVETVREEDLENCVRLLVSFLQRSPV